MEKADDPITLLREAIEAHRKLITGLKGDPRVKPDMWEEAWNPNQVAISLSGEPTIYPELGEFIAECKRRSMTTFLVTNGTLPKVLEHLDPLPTQLYVTVAAPNEGIFKKLCAPIMPNAWKNLNEFDGNFEELCELYSSRFLRLTDDAAKIFNAKLRSEKP